MVKKLHREAVKADLAAVNAVLSSRPREEDPVGWFQFSERRSHLERELAILEAEPESKSIALFFGGKPVVDSRGIAADFTSSVISEMQSLVAVQSASLEAALGQRGRVPQRDNSQMFITDVARGSFGFILEDIGQSPNLVSSAMEDVCQLLAKVASSETDFDSATETVDSRILVPLKNLFKTLDEGGATVRLVSDRQDFNLTREDVERARQRIDTLRVLEPYTETLIGRVFTMPDSKRFEVFPVIGGPVLKGTISPDFIKQMFDQEFSAIQDFNGKVMRVHLRVQETHPRKDVIRKSYQLIGVTSFE